MTANELADDLKELDSKLHLTGFFKVSILMDCAAMLRQQQAEIEALKLYKEKIEEMERRYDDHFAQAMGNPKLKKVSEK